MNWRPPPLRFLKEGSKNLLSKKKNSQHHKGISFFHLGSYSHEENFSFSVKAGCLGLEKKRSARVLYSILFDSGDFGSADLPPFSFLSWHSSWKILDSRHILFFWLQLVPYRGRKSNQSEVNANLDFLSPFHPTILEVPDPEIFSLYQVVNLG